MGKERELPVALRVRKRSRLRAMFLLGVPFLLLTLSEDSPATVEQQRQRLPPAAECSNNVEGKWLGLRWSSHRRPPEWYRVELSVKYTHSNVPDEIEGTINVRFWRGGEKAETPPQTCSPYEGIALQRAIGTATNGNIDFRATSWTTVPGECAYYGRYALDHYSGVIDPKLLEFQAENNDGAMAVHEPTVFRRIQCLASGTPEPTWTTNPVAVTPPAFTPKRRFGCGK